MKIFDTKPSSGLRVSHPVFFKAFMRMARAWETLTVHDGTVSWHNGIPTIIVESVGGSAGTAWDDINLGYSQSGNVVTVTAGALWYGTLDRIAIATADITIAANNTWIYVEHVFGSGTAALASGTTAPVDDVTTLRWPLSKWSYADSTATIAELCHVGDIVIKPVRGV